MSTVAPEPIIRARQISKAFSRGAEPALKDISLDVGRGEFLSLLGPSGCGKSTFLFMVGGLVRPTSGELFLGERPIRGPGRERGLVFQESALFPWLSVAANIAFGLRLRAGRQSAGRAVDPTVQDLLQLVGLTGLGDMQPHELSGGMKQRVAIAACLATDPEVLLMDEPFGALDAQTRTVMQRELLRLHESSGRTTIFVTHDIREAILLSDRVAVMSKRPGQIKEIVPIDLSRPRWEHLTEQSPTFLEYERYFSALLDHPQVQEDAAPAGRRS